MAKSIKLEDLRKKVLDKLVIKEEDELKKIYTEEKARVKKLMTEEVLKEGS